MLRRSFPISPLWALAAVGLSSLVGFAWLTPARAAAPSVELIFVYGSEKKEWLEAVTKDFLAEKPKINGVPIEVKLVPMGSGQIVDDVIDEVIKPQLISPASEAYLVIGNARAKAKNQEPLIRGDPQDLVFSPVVIAMWKPMAEALGWPKKEIGWEELHALAVANKDLDPKTRKERREGWRSKNRPAWGEFRLGHTNPELSNSGLLATLAQVAAATGKSKPALKDVETPATAKFIAELQDSITRYGESTGSFSKEMFKADGDKNFSATILYENLVIDSYRKPEIQAVLRDKVVAIYPKEGTFMSDHPVGVVNRKWVSDQQRQGAELYIKFLLDVRQQKRALEFGFRPASELVKVGAPIDADHGADPNKPGASRLFPPSAEVLEAGLKVWRLNRKKLTSLHLALVVDGSTIMQGGNRLEPVLDIAEIVTDVLGEGDQLSVVTFNDQVNWVKRSWAIKADSQARAALKKEFENAVSDPKGGRTSLYAAIGEATEELGRNNGPKARGAVIVIAASKDVPAGKLTPVQLRAMIPADLPIYTYVCAGAADTTDPLETPTGKSLAGLATGGKAKRASTPEIRKKIFELAD